VNAYVLIGGRSRRMGTSKSELFLPRIVAAARPLFGEVIAVQRHGGERANIETIFEEPHERDGAIFGVLRALRHAQSDAFVIAVDYPLVTTEVLHFLRDARAVPVWNAQPQPLCAVWSADLVPQLEAHVASGKLDLQGAVDREIIAESVLRARFPGEPLLNVNTPADLEKAEGLHGEGFLPPR
jgi:molybdopterin-guanine dinucleotide biosynthesis protein A